MFDLFERQRISNVCRRREADHFGQAVEVAEWIAHCRRLRNAPNRIKLISSDNVDTIPRADLDGDGGRVESDPMEDVKELVQIDDESNRYCPVNRPLDEAEWRSP